MAVQIKQITKKSDVLRFVKFGNEFYEGCENFCPALILDELDKFNVKKNPAFYYERGERQDKRIAFDLLI